MSSVERIEGEALTDYPTCPKCDGADQDYWDGLDGETLQYDGAVATWDCPFCGVPLEVTINISYSFDTVALVHHPLAPVDASDQTHGGSGR